MELKAARFWGGVKIPFSKAQVENYFYATITAPNTPEHLHARLPRVFWRTNEGVKNFAPIGEEFLVTVPEAGTFLEFFVEYSSDKHDELSSVEFDGVFQVLLVAPFDNYVFRYFGSYTYEFQVRRVDPRPYLYAQYHNTAVEQVGENHRSQIFQLGFNQFLRKATRVHLRDCLAQSLQQGDSEAALAQHSWTQAHTSGWPALSSSTTLLGSPQTYGDSTNAMVFWALSAQGPWQPVSEGLQSDSFVLPAGAQHFQIHRLYGAATIANALAAAQQQDPTVTRLQDALVLQIEDAGNPGPALVGRDNRLAPEALVELDLVP